MRRVSIALAFFIAAPAAAREPMTPAEQALATAASARGAMLYRYDQAAWHTTDALRSDLDAAAMKDVRGWVVVPAGDALEVIYYGLDGETPRALYAAQYDGRSVIKRRVFATGEDRSLAPGALNLLTAQRKASAHFEDLARKGKVLRCGRAPFNTVAVPSGEGSGAAVYFLTPQTARDAIPAGGHFRIDVTGSGTLEMRSFSKTCLDLPLTRAGTTPAMLVTTALLDDQPHEVHVFLVLSAKIPLAVLTRQKSFWTVAASGIALQRRILSAPKP